MNLYRIILVDDEEEVRKGIIRKIACYPLPARIFCRFMLSYAFSSTLIPFRSASSTFMLLLMSPRF